MKDTQSIFVYIFCFFIFSLQVYSQILPSPPWGITSEFGPRNIDNKYDWHKGIDYGGQEGDDILPVEGGMIAEIGKDEKNNRYISIDGEHGHWAYVHIFSDNLLQSGNWELRNVILKDPITGMSEQSSVIILWLNREQNQAEKVLSIYRLRERQVIIDGVVLNCLSQGSVGQEPIAPVGTSGRVTPHLHLALNGGADNPLLYIQHGTPNYTITIDQPESNQIIYHADPAKELIKLNINSTSGLDLDRLDIYLNKRGENFIDDAHRINETRNCPPIRTEINYGGLPSANPFQSYIAQDGNANRGSSGKTGINPLSEVPGNDDFYYIDFNSKVKVDYSRDALINEEARYPDGKYTMTARAESINGTYFDAPQGIIIDNFKPYLKKAEIIQDSETKYSAYWQWEDGEEILRPLPSEQKERQTAVVKGGTARLRLEFSEPMKEAKAGFLAMTPDVWTDMAMGRTPLDRVRFADLEPVPDTYEKVWEGDVKALPPELPITHYLIVTGKDIADNVLDGDPFTIAYRDPNNPGQWVDTNSGGLIYNYFPTPAYDCFHKVIIRGKTIAKAERFLPYETFYVPSWGQEFTVTKEGGVFGGGKSYGENNIAETLCLTETKHNIGVKSTDNWNFKTKSYGGGFAKKSYTTGGGPNDGRLVISQDNATRELIMLVAFYDADGTCLGGNWNVEPFEIFNYPREEYLK